MQAEAQAVVQETVVQEETVIKKAKKVLSPETPIPYANPVDPKAVELIVPEFVIVA